MEEKKEVFSGPIHAEYALEAEDVKAALRLSGRIKSRLGLHIFQSALAVLGLAVFLSSIAANPLNPVNYFLALLCLLILLLIWIYPMIAERQSIRKTVDGRRMVVELAAEGVRVSIPQSDMDDFFALPDIAPVKQNEHIFLLELPGGALLAIPKRTLPAGSQAAAAAILEKAGAARQTDDAGLPQAQGQEASAAQDSESPQEKTGEDAQ